MALYDDGASVLDRVTTLPWGCVLTDIRLPHIDGLELLRRLRAAGLGLPVVVMTGHGDVPLAVEALKLGASDCVEKPFEDEAFLRVLRSAADGGETDTRGDAGRRDFVRRLETLSAREGQVLEKLAGLGEAHRGVHQH